MKELNNKICSLFKWRVTYTYNSFENIKKKDRYLFYWIAWIACKTIYFGCNPKIEEV